MSNYTITTDFGAKDSLPSGNAAKVVKGSEFTAEFTNIQTAIATKLDLTSGSATNLTTTGTLTNSGAMTTTGVSTFNGAVNFASTTAHAGNATFSDNAKAIFGAGADLQIYHDGTDTHIVESGAGSLKIKGNFLQLLSPDNEKFFEGQANGASSLFYNGVAKLDTSNNGIDVTGTMTADGATVTGRITIQDATSPELRIVDGNNVNSDFLIYSPDGVNALNIKAGSAQTDAFSIASGGDISFYEETGTTPKLTWDASAEQLIAKDGAFLKVTETDSSTVAAQLKSDSDEGLLQLYHNGAEKVRLRANADSYFNGGNVGIGTDSPTEKLDIDGDSIRLRQSQTPASASATGSQGQIAWDANYMYVCTATDTWKRVALATW